MENSLPWIILIAHVSILLAIDFLVLHKKDSSSNTKKAIYETIFFVANALLFSGLVYWFYKDGIIDNPTNLTANGSVIKYITGYLIELSLSVDNLFVIAMIFASYKIPKEHQHRLLFLGILGAIVFRAILIGVGLVLIHEIHEITIVFGLFLLYTAIKMLFEKEDEPRDTSKGIAKYFNISNKLDGPHFTTIVDGKKVFTVLFGALITIEFTDLLFALDSIPAVLAVTTDAFIVFSSNIFAIMGLRSLYFFLANMLEKFHYMKYSVFVILIFVSIKLILASWIDIHELLSLSIIGLSLAIGIIYSLVKNKEK